jgi:hypothetical protein
MKRTPFKAPDTEETMRGKHKDTMKGMFNTKARDSESFH